jgi:acyl-coenzyme A synthetase/AMP-(fatty) acid ligase
MPSPCWSARWPHGGLMVSEQDWISTPRIALDYRGPTDRPFQPFGDPSQAVPIIERLQSVARRRAGAVAVVDDEGSLTFAHLMQSVMRLADAIELHQPSPSNVAILLPTGRAYVVAVYACLAAGRVAVLLDASFPQARNAAIAAATGVTLVLTQAGCDFIAAPGSMALAVDLSAGIGAATASATAGHIRQPLQLDAPAFILCTSGSSGLPKAIVHSQRTMLHLARTAHDALHVDENDRVMPLSSLSSLGGITPLLSYPLGGASLHLIDLKARGLGEMLGDLTEHPITILRAAPSTLRGLARLPESATAFSRLRIVQTYGESLTRMDLRSLRAVISPQCYVRSTYGSTEASGMSWFADESDAHDPIRLPTGALMPDTAAVIVDPNGAACARGEIGELVVRSRYNSLGEFVDGRLVAGRLQPDPIDPARRIYHTGDLARCDRDGVFVVLGRCDRMAKINGQRVEPAEIENVLRRHPSVDKAEVLALTRKSGTMLTAFVVAIAGRASGLERTLRDELRRSLPSFMVPSRVVLLETMPLLPGGKIDAQALRALAGELE